MKKIQYDKFNILKNKINFLMIFLNDIKETYNLKKYIQNINFVHNLLKLKFKKNNYLENLINLSQKNMDNLLNNNFNCLYVELNYKKIIKNNKNIIKFSYFIEFVKENEKLYKTQISNSKKFNNLFFNNLKF